MLIRSGSLVLSQSLLVLVLSLRGAQSFLPAPHPAESSLSFAGTTTTRQASYPMRKSRTGSTATSLSAALQRFAQLESRSDQRTRSLRLISSVPVLQAPSLSALHCHAASLSAVLRGGNETCWQSSRTACSCRTQQRRRRRQWQQHLSSFSLSSGSSFETSGTQRGSSGEMRSSLSRPPSASASAARRAFVSGMTSRNQDPLSSSSSSEDTIFALATGNAGPAGVAVVRISGPKSAAILRALTTVPTAVPASGAGAARGDSSRSSPSEQQQKQPSSMAPNTPAPTESSTIAVRGPEEVEEEAVEGVEEGRKLPPFPAARRAVLRRLYDPASGDLLDEALVLWMPGPRSFTGEDTVELHTHGSRAVINGVLDALAGLGGAPSSSTSSSGMKIKGVRLAERGEFTQRAYGNGRMDLTGVEGLADLIAADTAAQRKQALKQMGGALRDMYEEWRNQLKGCLAHAEAVIDFGDDEEDVGGDAAFAAMMPRVESLAAEIDRHLRDGGRGEIVRSGVRVAIVGPPNAGKSSLLNLLAARPAAIVSPVAGTTRDVVEVQMDIGGLPVTLSDTAGLREATDDLIEREGMRRARDAVEDAHLAIFVVDTTDAEGATALLEQLREEAAVARLDDDAAAAADMGAGVFAGGKRGALDELIVVANKADLAPAGGGRGGGDHDSQLRILAAVAAGASETTAAERAAPSVTLPARSGRGRGAGVEEDEDGTGAENPVGRREGAAGGLEESSRIWKLSCKTKEGFNGFMEHLEEEVRSRFQGAAEDESPLITRRRHRQHVEACLVALRAAQTPRMPLDLAAEELRIASSELGRITGAVGVEELLDVIFRDFCIGK